MKKILYILFSICLLTACSSDDENTKDPNEQDYTSFVFMQNFIEEEPNVIIGYKTEENVFTKLAELGNLKKGEYSKEVKITNNAIKELYYFSDYLSTRRHDVVYILESNKKNVFKPTESTKGNIVYDKTDPTQYPQ